MDTSETYIKMCDCPEIQEGKKSVERGDYWCWKSYPERVYFHSGKYPLEMFYSRNERDGNNKIWLPRQDQLQEMHLYRNYSISDLMVPLLENFRDFYFRLIDKKTAEMESYTSMEQLWLAFYMKEKHNKTWDGEKWDTSSN